MVLEAALAKIGCGKSMIGEMECTAEIAQNALHRCSELLWLSPQRRRRARPNASRSATASSLRCDHHAQVDGRMRLYLSAGEDNYIEFAPS